MVEGEARRRSERALDAETPGGITVATTLMNQLGDQAGGKNVVLVVIVAWAAVRAVAATYKLPRLAKLEVQPNSSVALPGQ